MIYFETSSVVIYNKDEHNDKRYEYSLNTQACFPG